MEHLGTDFNITGSVMSREDLEELRKKRGECITCGRKCFKKKFFKMVPLDEKGEVLNGRCLQCHPLSEKDGGNANNLPSVTTPISREASARFAMTQSNLSTRNVFQTSSSSMGVGGAIVGGNRRGHLGRAQSANAQSCDSRSGEQLRNPAILSPSSTRPTRRRPGGISQAVSSESPTPTRGLHHSESVPLPLPPAPRPRVQASRSAGPGLPLDDFPTANGVNRGGTSSSAHNSMAGNRTSPIAANHQSPLSPREKEISSSNRSPLPEHLDHQERCHFIPTSDDLQRARMTILAAKEHGLFEDTIESLKTGDSNNQRYPSAGSLHSSASTPSEPPVEIDGFTVPQHGVLNRGGAFNIGSPPPHDRRLVEGSSRTIGSMSSIEEEFVPPLDRRPVHVRIPPAGAVEAVYEEDECHMLSPSEVSQQTDSAHSPQQSPSRIENFEDTEEDFVSRIRSAGNDYTEILITMREAVTSEIVVHEGLEGLARLQLNPEDHDVLADLEAPHVIADAMQCHRGSLLVQLWGCGAVWNMSGTYRNQIAFVDAAILDGIVDAMENFIDSIDVQEKAIATLSNLGAAEENLAIMIDQGAVHRIVDAMNKHSEDGSIQVKGCSAITNLASHDTPLKTRLMELGAGGAVVIAMVLHPKDFYLQEKALRALRNLCANHDQNKIELASIGGIDAVVGAMQLHRDEVIIQEEGSWTLSNLAGNDDNKAVIGDCGGIDVVIRAMWVHSDNIKVQEWCCRALFTLTLDERNGSVVLEVGGITAIVNAMQGHDDSATVQEMGCAVLGNLSSKDESKMRIVDEEALDAIVLAMILHTDDVQVQERACMVLWKLAIAENFTAMRAANIAELALVAGEKFPDRCQDQASLIASALGR